MRRRRRLLLFAVLAALAPDWPLAAQLGGVQNGQRVRITLVEQARSIEGATTPQVLRGQLLRSVGDSAWLALHPGAGPAAISLGAIAQLEVSRGVETWWEGAWRRGQQLALMLGIEAFVFRIFSDGPFDNVFEAGLVGAGIGLVGGGIHGALRPQEIWEGVPWPAGQAPGRTGQATPPRRY